MTDSLLEVDVFQFEFNEDGAPTKLHIDDRWSSSISCEDFGLYLLISYTQQRAKFLAPPVLATTQQVVDYPVRFTDLVADLSESLPSSLAEITLTDLTTAQLPEPMTTADSRCRVQISVTAGVPHAINISPVWIRGATLDEIESACLEAFQALQVALDQEPTTADFRKLQKNLRELVLEQNDYAKGCEL